MYPRDRPAQGAAQGLDSLPMASNTAPSARGSWRCRLAALWIPVGLAAAAATLERTVPVWPRAGLRLQGFDDRGRGGASRSSLDTAGAQLRLSIRLDSGTAFPVAGAILHLASRGKSLDLSAPGDLRLEIGPSSLQQLQVCLVEEIPGFTREDRWQSARYDCQDANLVPGQSSYALPLDRFLTPAWWYATAGVRPSDLGPESRSRVVRMVIQSGDGTPLRDPREVRFERIETTSLHPLRSALLLLAGLAAALLHFRLARRAPVAPAPAGPIQFEPVEAVSYADRERQAVVQHIGSAYPDPDLSLESVSRATGVPVDRVTSHVKAASGLLFKAYLNRVRVESARKLLVETDLPVSEIATRVGYGNISHFNRIFREVCGTTPSALREEGSGLSQSPSEPAKSA